MLEDRIEEIKNIAFITFLEEFDAILTKTKQWDKNPADPDEHILVENDGVLLVSKEHYIEINNIFEPVDFSIFLEEGLDILDFEKFEFYRLKISNINFLERFSNDLIHLSLFMKPLENSKENKYHNLSKDINFSKLRFLDLSWANYYSFEFIKHIKAENLGVLLLNNSTLNRSFDHDSLSVIDYPNLRQLDLDETCIYSIAALSGVSPNLEVLTLYCTGFAFRNEEEIDSEVAEFKKTHTKCEVFYGKDINF